MGLFLTSQLGGGPFIARAACCLAYAHWEGSFKAVVGWFLEYVDSQALTLADLSSGMAALALAPEFTQAGVDGRSDISAEVVRAIRGGAGPTTVASHSEASGRGIVDWALFSRWADLLGLDLTYWELKRQWIEQALLARRHRIAHGAMEPVGVSEAMEVISNVREFLDHFALQVIYAAEDGGYRAVRAPAAQTGVPAIINGLAEAQPV